MRTLEQIISNLNDTQKQLFADTINHGGWGNCDTYLDGEYVMVWGYITNFAYKGGHFDRRSLSNRFRSLFKALGLQGDKKWKRCADMEWCHDWWEDGTGYSVLFLRQDMQEEFENWAKNYNK